MVRFINKPILVESYQEKPQKITWQDKVVTVLEIMEHWKDTGCWWENETEKDFFRITSTDQRIWEIFHDRQNTKWFLYKVYD